jgi:signal transduction histidine kinase
VEACIEEIRPAATAKGIQIEASLAPDTTLWGDRGRLAQVVQNLLSNALKFTPNGGRVFVELAQRDRALVLSVHDTGMGIPPWDQPHVFEPFRTGDGSTTRTYGGLGLGLCLVRYIVEAHGGTVRAESAGPGRGATLVVELDAPVLASPP